MSSQRDLFVPPETNGSITGWVNYDLEAITWNPPFGGFKQGELVVLYAAVSGEPKSFLNTEILDGITKK